MTIDSGAGVRRVLGAVVLATLLVASVAGVAGVAAATPRPSTTWQPSTIVNHVFTRNFQLDHGALTITPFHGVAPSLSPATATEMWATSPLAGQEVGMGFGVVSVDATRTTNLQQPRVTALQGVRAFVALTDDADIGYMCPLMRGPGSKVVPVSHGWEAVIFPLDPTKSDAVFAASSNVCGRVTPDTINTAFLVLSVRWHLSTSATAVVVSVPACAKIDGYGGGGGGYVNPQPLTFQASVYLLLRPLGQPCSPPTNFDAGPAFASPTTVHGPTGPLRQVRPATPPTATPPTATPPSG